jgi:signal peptidase II
MIARKYTILLATMVVVLVLDQATKWYILTHVRLHSVQPVIPGFLNITHVQNTGAAFGLLAGQPCAPYVFGLIGVLAVLLILYYLRRIPRDNVVSSLSLSLVLTGAVGNMIDRLRFGGVVDFIDVQYKHWHWPAFNVADSSITVGIILLALTFMWGGRKSVP